MTDVTTDTVSCAVCGAEMSVINNRHLRRHGLSAADYRAAYPDRALISQSVSSRLSARSRKSNASRKGVARSEETKKRMREAQAQLPSRKGVSTGAMSDAQKQLLSSLAKQRYTDGCVHSMQGKKQPAIVAEKIAKTLSGRKIGPAAALKAIQTRRDRGDDLAVMRGRTHTDATKQLIGEKSKQIQRAKRSQKRAHMMDRFQAARLHLLNQIGDDIFQLQCTTCNYTFSRTPQCFQPSKYHCDICPQCHPPAAVSAAENDVATYLAEISSQRMYRSDTSIIGPLELDIVLPDRRLAIEYCGLYFHSVAAGRNRFYHQQKMLKCRNNNLHLLTVFEDEWLLKRAIVQSLLRNACGLTVRKLNARQCSIRSLDRDEGIAFLNENHIQGRGRSIVKYGLFHETELVSVMTFMKGDIAHRSTAWEINRFATKINCNVRGGASRLFQRFVADQRPERVTSFADLRWGEGTVYGQLGFKRSEDSLPNYWYIKGLQRYHRYALRKTSDDPVDQTEFQIRAAQGWNWIYDCGHAKWLWTAN